MDEADADAYDAVFAGMGLANALAALRTAQKRPDLRLAGFDGALTAGAGRTWSFFMTDVTPVQADWLRPLLRCEWPGYEVRFPGFSRVLGTTYFTLSATALDKALERALGSAFHRGCPVQVIAPGSLTLVDGRQVRARAVLDGRGARPTRAMRCGWQKFLGQEVRLAAPHGLARPVLMDARVPQIDGYRFIYLLPYGPRDLLIEDTRYSDARQIDIKSMRAAIRAYAADKGWVITDVLAEEQGALPVLLDGDIDAFWNELGEVPPTGVRAGLAHPVTGYSVSSAVALADALAAVLPNDPVVLHRMIQARARSAWDGQGFHRLLNRMLFLAGPADERWRIFRRFFSLPKPLIERFFAGHSTLPDRMRMLIGKPPVALLPAIRCISRRSAAAVATVA